MLTPIEGLPRSSDPDQRRGRVRGLRTVWLLAIAVGLTLAGCGEPSEREYKNRRELEALLTAITLRNKNELDRDMRRIEERHDAGELSDASHKDLQEIIQKAQAGDWGEAEKEAYLLRESKPFFD